MRTEGIVLFPHVFNRCVQILMILESLRQQVQEFKQIKGLPRPRKHDCKGKRGDTSSAFRNPVSYFLYIALFSDFWLAVDYCFEKQNIKGGKGDRKIGSEDEGTGCSGAS